MNHIDIYLKLEKLRFGEYLEVVYNIEEQDFMIPSLTIQPLVENAVKYGVGDKREGGQVIIGTTSTDTHYIITIEDTGTGFDINKEYNDGRQHVGIQNVKERLSLICNGELIIHSEIDKGTVAIIRIPKDYGGGVK
jgi:sensor histidine kinase YesM